MIQMARPKNPDSIPITPGVYSIWEIHDPLREDSWEECLFVGSASNLRNRVNQHHLLMRYLRTHSQVRVEYHECALDQLAVLERIIIAKAKPTMNRTLSSTIEVRKR